MRAVIDAQVHAMREKLAAAAAEASRLQRLRTEQQAQQAAAAHQQAALLQVRRCVGYRKLYQHCQLLTRLCGMRTSTLLYHTLRPHGVLICFLALSVVALPSEPQKYLHCNPASVFLSSGCHGTELFALHGSQVSQQQQQPQHQAQQQQLQAVRAMQQAAASQVPITTCSLRSPSCKSLLPLHPQMSLVAVQSPCL